VGTEAELGLVLCELADVHRDAARLIPSIQNYQAALEYQPADSYPRERVNTLRNLGRAFAQMERYDDARTAWTEALELSHDLPDHSPDEIALTYHAIAEAHRIQANYQDAELSYRESLHYHAPNSVAAAATWRALGQALHAAGRHQDAIDPLERALDAEKTQPQQVNARIVQTLQLLAETQVSCTNYTAAIARYHEALVYMDRALQPVLYAESLRALGKLYADAKNWDQAQIALKEALDIESSHAPRNEERISTTLQQIADTYRAAGDLEMAAEYYQKVTVYASLTRRASDDLRETLDELERRRATLQAAQQSLALLDRSDASNLKDLSFIHALIAKSYASLNQPRESADTIRSLLEILEARRENLDTDDAQPDIQALAWLARAYYAEGQNDLDAARLACQRAKHHVRNSNLRWVIEQVTRSLES
jgi:tetratricopeptide (TPR) repeat protein